MNAVFDVVYRFLVFISNLTHLTYQEINIIVYYIIAPLIYFFLIDKIYGFHYLKITFSIFVILFLLLIPNFENFSYKTFIASQHFLQGFGFLGMNYTVASVVICVIVPFIVFVWLFLRAYKERLKKLFKKNH